MFNFFHSIIAKIAIGISSVALFFSGAVATPPLAPQDATSSPKIEIVATSSATVAATKKTEASAKQDTSKDNKDSLIGSLKKQVADLTQKANQPSQPKVEAPKTSVITLPSGAVVEMDANGNVIRTIKEAPQPTYTVPTYTPPAPSNSQSQNTTAQTILNVSGVVATPATDKISFEWNTNVPSEGKVFLSGPGYQTPTVVPSISGVSTHHVLTITGLSPVSDYSYTVESIAGDKSAKATGSFKTQSKARMDIVVKAGDPCIVSSTPTARVDSVGDCIRFEVRTYNSIGVEVKFPITATTNTPDLPSSFVFNSTDPNNQVQFVSVCKGWNPKNGAACPVDHPSAPGDFSITFYEPVNDITKTVDFKVY